MRFLRDILLVLLIAAAGAGGFWYTLDRDNTIQRLAHASAERHRLEMEIKYRAATKTADLNSRGWPSTVDPEWFHGDPPLNPLISDDHPWLEIASPDQATLAHPPMRIAIDPDTATYWYNPYQGIVRARVPVMVSDDQATSIYNKLNLSSIPSILWTEPDATPKPTNQTATQLATQPSPSAADGKDLAAKTDANADLKGDAKSDAKSQAKPTTPPAVVRVRKTKP